MTKSKTFWSHDEQYGKRMDQTYEEGEQFLVMKVELGDPITDPTTGRTFESRTILTTRAIDPSTLQPIGLPVKVSTLSGPIYERAKESTDGFPAIVTWRKVPVKKYGTEATVLEQVCPYPVPDDILAMMNGEA